MEFCQTNKGKSKILFEGFIYNKQKALANEAISWECEDRRRKHCNARIKVRNQTIIGRVNEHTHGPSCARVDALKVCHIY